MQYLTPNDFHGYQHTAIQHMVDHPQSMLWLDMGLGKLQKNSEPVLTPSGWVQMGDIRPGDFVIGSNGRPTEVVSIHPQGVKAQYRFTLNDKSWTYCGAEHLWYVESPCQKMRGQKGRVLTTQQLMDGGLTDAAGNRKWHIPLVKAVAHETRFLPIDPYLLGVILGDGSVTKGGGTSVCTDLEILENTGAFNIKPHKTSEYTGYGVYRLNSVLCDAGLAGKRSWEKFIPEEYLISAVWQRHAILQGLLDTDGSPMETSGIEYSSTSEALTDGVVALVQSLGGVARKSGPRITRHQGGDGRPSWRVNVKLPNEFVPFRLERKRARWSPTTKYLPARLIDRIELDGEEESTCIRVVAEDHLYVTRNYIVTHNTVSALTAMLGQRDRMEVWGTLIVAPLRVIQAVWRQEARKWSHLDHQYKFSLIAGTKADRERALFTRADVYLINFENLPWLLDELERRWLAKGRYLPFNQIIWDEISKMKNTRVQQGVARGVAALKMLPYITHRVGLTGTPAGKGLLDLFGQYLCVDDGARLGTSFDTYKKTYFYPDPDDWHQRKWILLPGAEQEILSRVSDITISMRSEDYLDLPPLLVNDIYVDLTPKLQKQYKEMERELLLSFDSGHELEIDSAASLVNRCLQFANGACYKAPGNPEWENIHDLKLEALVDIVEEAAGKSILIMYEFQHDAEKIMKKFPGAKRINSQLPEREFNEIVAQWNAGLLPMLIGHPASIGHGINIQGGGNTMVWYGLNWSLELYMQALARLRRQGQKNVVIAHRIMTRDTFDEVVRLRLACNEETEQSMRSAIEQYRRG